MDELNSDFAKFYFSDEAEAAAFAACHQAFVQQTSPIAAGGGLWMVAVPYSAARHETVEAVHSPGFVAQLDASIEIGRAAIARVGGAL